jgi:hypothetical protein
MYVQRNIVARSHNHQCSGNTRHSVCVCVELYVTVKCIKILSVAQQCFYGKIMSLTTIKRT